MGPCYVAFIHPTIERDLRDMSARLKYKTQSHNERYKRRYGQYPELYKAEIGLCQSFRFIADYDQLAKNGSAWVGQDITHVWLDEA